MKPILFGIVLAFISSLAVSGGELRAAENDDSTTGAITISPSLSGIFVDGDDNKFREDSWLEDGVTGGIDNFSLRRQLGNKTTIEVQGRAIVPEENYRLDLHVDRQDIGYVHAGYKEYRKYFDDTGGFFNSFSESSFDLGKDMHLDIGNVFIEAGLTLPNRPKLIVGYEHRFKDGEKSLLEWGGVSEGGTQKLIFPSFKEIDEKTDVVRLEINHEIANIQLGDEFRYESYRIDTRRHEKAIEIGDPTATETVTVNEDYEHDALYNTFHASTHLNEKTFLALGYLFTTLEGDASFRMATLPGNENRDKHWLSNVIDIDQDVHIANINATFGPFHKTTIYLGLQGEKLDKHGDTDAILTEVVDDVGTLESPSAISDSEENKVGIEETLGIRYTGLPRTTVYAEGRWTQQDINLTETELEDGALELDRDTDTQVRRQRYSIGFNSSPLPRTTVAARYRFSYRSNDYDHERDNTDSYSAFILDQDFTTHTVMAKVSFRPVSRIRASLKYLFTTMNIDTDEDTDPTSSVQTTNYDSSIYTASLTATPLAGLFLTGLVSYQDVRLETVNVGDNTVVSYNGDVLSLAASAGMALDARTNLNIQYSFSLAENFENIASTGLPLGVENQRHAVLASLTRRITDNLSVKLRYGFYNYDDNASDGSDNYSAHLIGATCSMIF